MSKDNASGTDSSKEAKASSTAGKSPRRSYLLAGVTGLTALALLVGGFAIGQAYQGNTTTRSDTVRLAMHRDIGPEPRAHVAEGMRGEMKQHRYAQSDTENTTRVAGVVTAVSGSTLTVAGNGTTTKVEVSDNTTYHGSDEPAQVNDTIRVRGATNSDGVLVASHVHLARQ